MIALVSTFGCFNSFNYSSLYCIIIDLCILIVFRVLSPMLSLGTLHMWIQQCAIFCCRGMSTQSLTCAGILLVCFWPLLVKNLSESGHLHQELKGSVSTSYVLMAKDFTRASSILPILHSWLLAVIR